MPGPFNITPDQLRAERRERRKRARERAHARTRQRDRAAGVYSRSWYNASVLAQKWARLSSMLIMGLCCCAFCGVVSLGTTATDGHLRMFELVPPPSAEDVPPAMLANPALADFTTQGDEWYCCPACMNDQMRATRTSFLTTVSVHYGQMLFACDPAETQLLGLLDVNLGLTQRYKGFIEGAWQSHSLLDGPLVRWGDAPAPGAAHVAGAVQDLLGWNLQHNPLFQRHATLLETPHHTRGFPILTAEAVAGILKKAIERMPLGEAMEQDWVPAALTAVTSAGPPLKAPSASHNIYIAGEMVLRDTLEPRRLLTRPDGTPPGSAAAEQITAESAMFPFLFPFGRGFFTGAAWNLIDYLKMRCSQLFSIYTLYKPFACCLCGLKVW